MPHGPFVDDQNEPLALTWQGKGDIDLELRLNDALIHASLLVRLGSGSACRPLGYLYPITVGVRFSFAQEKAPSSAAGDGRDLVLFEAQ